MTELGEWCAECSVQVKIYKCETMHMRKKGVKRSEQKFVMNGEAVQNRTEYMPLPGLSLFKCQTLPCTPG